ncbi:uncharacterized protein FIBRA_04115 [Fibroporia radiculosa]|uniref:NADP-dependent oxidoreductase domain-containing protein n=1 Tax=Fibroporia radiculosa TaxID=599839 RepID=J4H2S6_9APHY|nr:uncharacterized protein FIBRA_04115 [Fibroporia radiculosa]CCM02039.1 predicted protein [Fibroporia radiculosa]
MSFFVPPKPLTTKLGRHRALAPLAGVHVSPICLGAMSIGDQWAKIGMGQMDKESSFALLDAFYNAGGNFIDTANGYQDETSEIFLGEWMESRGVRDQIVVATKYTSNWKRAADIPQKSSYVGNNMKSLHVSLEASLKKLRTNYVDILYVHWWDWESGVEEVMNGLHHLVAAGKVLYLGISDTPAWIVSRANMYARLTGKTPFVVYQGAWSILSRDFERDIIPMARVEGMALAPWNVLHAGKIRTDAEEERRRQTGEKGRTVFNPEWERTPEERKVCLALEKVASEVGAPSITSVAIAYVLQKTPYVFPIVGGRKIEHLMDNIAALDITLTPEHIKELESVKPFDVGFPSWFCGDGTELPRQYAQAGHFDKWPLQQAIRPS